MKNKSKNPKVDIAHDMTDREILALEKRIAKVYTECGKEIQDEMNLFSTKFKKKDAIYREKIKKGEMSIEDYKKWLKGQVFQGKQWALRKESIANSLYNSNKIALEMVNKRIPEVFQLNANFMAYDIEKKIGVDVGFQLYNPATIKALLKDDAKILPFKKLKKSKDVKWNFVNIKNEVAKGIIKGESIDKIAKRLSSEIPNRNYAMLKTHARTMVSSAQNQGRMRRFYEAQEKGIDVKKQWVAVLDERTRFSHAMLDGQIRDLDEDFEVDGLKIREPADPFAHPSLTYNCRCTMRDVLGKYPREFRYRRNNETGEIIKEMTFKDWEEYKEHKRKQ
jgi:SPP1 gp7 family putative phage head morphogenesis protein